MARETCPVATPEPLQEPLIDPMDPSVEEDAVADTGDKYEFQEPPRKLWSGNTNVWMAAGSLYIIWFVLQRGTWRFTLPISTLGGTHVICASLFAIICCMNVFHTPSHGPAYRHVHIWLGRAAMLIGVVSVVTGMIVLYSNEFPLGFRIGLTIGGIGQISLQILGMWAMYKPQRCIKLHANAMHVMLLVICFIPAIQRLPEMLGIISDGSSGYFAWYPIAISLSVPLVLLSFNAQKRQSWF